MVGGQPFDRFLQDVRAQFAIKTLGSVYETLPVVETSCCVFVRGVSSDVSGRIDEPSSDVSRVDFGYGDRQQRRGFSWRYRDRA